jgi:hypothetical protein
VKDASLNRRPSEQRENVAVVIGMLEPATLIAVFTVALDAGSHDGSKPATPEKSGNAKSTAASPSGYVIRAS